MGDRSILLTPDEMESRFAMDEDPFDLVIEKWERLEKYLERAFTLDDFSVFLAASQVPIPFCHIYGARGKCSLCPVAEICRGGEEDEETLWGGLYRLIQAYGWAGDILHPEPLKRYLRRFIESLKELRCKTPSAGTPRISDSNHQ